MKTSYSLQTPVGVYQSDAKEPTEFVSIDDARKLRKSGDYFSINCGKDIRRAGEREPIMHEFNPKSRWKSVPSGLQSIGYVNVLQLV